MLSIHVCASLLAALALLGCAQSGPGQGSVDSEGVLVRATPPLPGVAAIVAAPSVPIKRRERPLRASAASAAAAAAPAKVWLYVSNASRANLMTLGADPTSSTRIWEHYLTESAMPFKRIATPAEIAQLPADSVLILASLTVLSDAEKEAVVQWRNRGGAVLSTWMTGTHSATGEALGFGFMRDVLDVQVTGTTKDEVEDTFMMVHGDSPVSHSLQAGTRVWLERVPNQLPLRLVGRNEGAQIMDWSRNLAAKRPAGLISYNERQMPSGKHSRVVSLGYPEQNWLRSDPRQLKAITGDVFAWLLRQPRAYLGAWPHPYTSSLLFAMQSAEVVAAGDVAIAKTISDMGGRMTNYVLGDSSAKGAPMIQQMKALGHEIAYLGDSFESFSGQSRSRQEQRLDAMQKAMASAGLGLPPTASFAPPLDGYDKTTQALLQERRFDNYMAFSEVTDSQLPFIASKAPGEAGHTVVLPRTLVGPEEAAMDDADSGLDNFMAALALSSRMGGLAVVRLPSGSLLLPEQLKRVFDAMHERRSTMWITTASQIAQWWRERSQVSVSFEADARGHVLSANVARKVSAKEPLTLWIDLPHPSAQVRLTALEGTGRLPVVAAAGAGRAVLTWREPEAGSYKWLVEFDNVQRAQ